MRPVTSAKLRGGEARRLGYTTILDVEAGSVRAAVERAMMASTSSRERELDAAF